MAEQRPTETTDRVREVLRDGFTIMVGAASWAFEQGDRLIGNWRSEGQLSQREGRKRFDEFTNRTRQASEDLSRRVSDSVRSARSSMPLATRDQVASLERRVEELTRQIESMKSTGASGTATIRDPRPPLS